jgi:hypothetical protein
MPYHPNIPQSTDDPASSQQDLLDNFQALQTQFAVNHISLTAGAQQGYHSQVWFAAPLSSDPGLASPQTSVYSKSVSGVAQLFFQNGPLSPANVYQLTGLPVMTSGTNYGIVTPWGLTINMGRVASSPITFAQSFSGTVYTALLTYSGTSVNFPYVVSVNTTTLTYQTAANAVYYFVVGAT